MKYKEMSKEKKDFCLDVVCNIYDSKARNAHTKNKAASAVRAAYHHKYAEWPVITANTVQRLLHRAKIERGVITMPEANGKGMICTYSPQKNNTPAFIDHTQSIVASQNKIGSTIKNLRENGIYPLAVIMLQSANLGEKETSSLMEPVQNGNIQIAKECQKTKQVSEIKYRKIAYITDENGIDHEVSVNQIQQ